MKSKLFSFFILFFLISCTFNNPNEEIEEIIDYNALNEIEIQKYISDNNLNPNRTESGLYYIIHNIGNGEKPNESSTVNIYLKSYFTNKEIFYETEIEGIELSVENLIPGFKEGLLLLNEGAEATFLIPSKLGYGEKGNPFSNIPPNTVTLYDLKFFKIL